jgi:hypothetical protein
MSKVGVAQEFVPWTSIHGNSDDVSVGDAEDLVLPHGVFRIFWLNDIE